MKPGQKTDRRSTGRQQQRLREHCEANHLARRPELEKAYGVAKQPRALTGSMWRAPKMSRHAKERQVERGVTNAQMNDAMKHPLYSEPVHIGKDGRKSQKHVGREATVVVNPNTGVIITTYKTKAKYRQRYEKLSKENGDD